MKLNLRNRFLQSLIATHIQNNPRFCLETKGSYQCSQESATGSYPKPVETNEMPRRFLPPTFDSLDYI
jgi:hypothetical protein